MFLPQRLYLPAARPSSLGFLPDGFDGVMQTLRTMRTIVLTYKKDSRIREFALNLVANLAPKDWAGEVARLFEFVRDDIRYVMDINDVETLHTPDAIIEIAQGDCDDKCILLATLLETIGHPARFVIIGYIEPGAFEHVYVETLIGKNWIALDPTEDQDVGWEPPNPVSKRVFNV
jgi:transglutaminase-like putative cysteine protease